MKKGLVYLIGAGPGDVGLFTLRGRECLSEADVVVYDYLVNPGLLGFARIGAEKIYVGKTAGEHTSSQDEINRMLVEHAQGGKTVARLKGGDPFIFGRGGEEAVALRGLGIDFEVVPGVPASIGASAYAGIPLTHRSLASSVAFITGHAAAEKDQDQIDWEKIAVGIDTLVFYMGVSRLSHITGELIKYGRAPRTPSAIISWGTLAKQKTITGPLEKIAELAEKAGLTPPSLIVIGEVVSLRDALRWFDTKPLFGKKIAVTRSRSQASRLCTLLSRLGADVIELPTIEIEEYADLSALGNELSRLGGYSHIVFTSANSVRIFFDNLKALGRDGRALAGTEIVAIGSGTGAALDRYGITPDLVPPDFTSEGTVSAMREKYPGLKGKRILLPGSEIARDYIPAHLREMGADTRVVPLYRNKQPDYKAESFDDLFRDSEEVYFTFTSSSTVANLVSILEAADRLSLIPRIRGFSIGPVTSQTAREAGIDIKAEAEPHTIDGLVQAILEHASGLSGVKA